MGEETCFLLPAVSKSWAFGFVNDGVSLLLPAQVIQYLFPVNDLDSLRVLKSSCSGVFLHFFFFSLP